jgi:hypothetical protein
VGVFGGGRPAEGWHAHYQPGRAFGADIDRGVPAPHPVPDIARRLDAGALRLPNLVVASSTTFDANKFFQLMWIPTAVLAAWLIRDWPRPVIAVVVALSVASPALIAVWHVRDDRPVLSLDQERTARWIEVNTPQRSVFVTDAFLNSPVDLAGRLQLTTYDPHITAMGYDPSTRDVEVRDIYCGGPTLAESLMRREGATYVLNSGGLLELRSESHAHRFRHQPGIRDRFPRRRRHRVAARSLIMRRCVPVQPSWPWSLCSEPRRLQEAVMLPRRPLWPMYHLDAGRSGNDTNEPSFNHMSKAWFSSTLDGAVYAEPLC